MPYTAYISLYGRLRMMTRWLSMPASRTKRARVRLPSIASASTSSVLCTFAGPRYPMPPTVSTFAPMNGALTPRERFSSLAMRTFSPPDPSSSSCRQT